MGVLKIKLITIGMAAKMEESNAVAVGAEGVKEIGNRGILTYDHLIGLVAGAF